MDLIRVRGYVSFLPLDSVGRKKMSRIVRQLHDLHPEHAVYLGDTDEIADDCVDVLGAIAS